MNKVLAIGDVGFPHQVNASYAMIVGLKSLDLSNNNLEALTISTPTLHTLDLTNNELTSVDQLIETLQPLKALRALSVDKNKMFPKSHRHQLALGLPQLQSLDTVDIEGTRRQAQRIEEAVQSTIETMPTAKRESDVYGAAAKMLGKAKLSMAEQDFLKLRIKCTLAKNKSPMTAKTSSQKRKNSDASELPKGSETTAVDAKKGKNSTSKRQATRTLRPLKSKTPIRATPADQSKPRKSLPGKSAGAVSTQRQTSKVSRISIPNRSDSDSDSSEPLAISDDEKIASNLDEHRQKRLRRDPVSSTEMISPAQYSYKLHSILRAHGDQVDGVLDASTEVWDCAFAPTRAGLVGKSIVATCGGNSVCFIDCQLGKVTQKYTHDGEQFCVVAWTVIPVKGLHEDDSGPTQAVLVAAAGLNGDIKLIDYSQRKCYAQLAGHTACVSALRFDPKEKSRLVSADLRGDIIVWKIRPFDGTDGPKSTEVIKIDCGELTTFDFFDHNRIISGDATGRIKLWTIKPVKNGGQNEAIAVDQACKLHKSHVDTLERLRDGVFASRAIRETWVVVWAVRTYAGRGSKAPAVTPLCRLAFELTDLMWIRFSHRSQANHKAIRILVGSASGVISEFASDKLSSIVFSNSSVTAAKSVTAAALLSPCNVHAEMASPGGGTTRAVVESSTLDFMVAVHDHNLVSIWHRDKGDLPGR